VSEKLEAMKNQALHVHQQFTSVIRTQNYLRYREARHRNTAERFVWQHNLASMDCSPSHVIHFATCEDMWVSGCLCGVCPYAGEAIGC
jgi:hypothetical protein